MGSKGYIRKALNSRGEVVVVAIEACALVQEQMERLQAHPSAMIHLGQALMAAALLQALGDPEENDKVQAEWIMSGDFGHLYAEALGTAKVRGSIGNPQASAEALGKDLGAGLLRVRRHHSGTMNTGMIESTGRVSTDLVEYLEKSEQRMCGSNLSVKIEWDEHPREGAPPFQVKSAHGYMVHILPQTNEAKRAELLLRWDGQMGALGPVSKWGLPEDQQEATMNIIQLLCSEASPRLLLGQEVELYCTCSEDRALRAVALLEASELPVSSEPNTVRCEFCGAVYKIG